MLFNTYSLRASKYSAAYGTALAGLVHELANVSWTEKQMVNSTKADLERDFPPFAVFPVNGDPTRKVMARKFAYALLHSLNAHVNKINEMEVSI